MSETDRGQVDAINRGLRRATGEWLCWQNSDDIFFPGAFEQLAEAAAEHPADGLIIGNMMLIDEMDRPLRDLHYVTPDHGAMLAEGMLLANQAAFWRRDVQQRIGPVSYTHLDVYKRQAHPSLSEFLSCAKGKRHSAAACRHAFAATAGRGV